MYAHVVVYSPWATGLLGISHAHVLLDTHNFPSGYHSSHGFLNVKHHGSHGLSILRYDLFNAVLHSVPFHHTTVEFENKINDDVTL